MESLGNYRLLKKIAVGGMAEIWVATTTNAGIQRVCVVKRILPHLAETADFVRMFLDEARIVATLTHPNLVQLLDVGEVDGRPFIAMEYLHGADVRTLKRALRTREGARMPLEHALNIGMGSAAGLHYAHEKVGLDGKPLNVVHRDISPQNILVTFDGGVKVLDFGIAKSDARPSETKHGTLKGKIPYMSPEQCLCEPLDRRSDIYSLGVVLYELTTGHRVRPAGASEYELIRSIVEGTVTPPTQVDPAFPPALEAIILRCLARERVRRYPTARALLADLESFAREGRLATTQLSLSSYMSELFGKRAEAWREALAAGGAQLAELAVSERDGAPEGAPARAERPTAARSYGALLEVRERAEGAAEKPRPARVEPAPASVPSTPPVSAGADLQVSRRKVGPIAVVSLVGRINERFQGGPLGQSLAGRTVLDLAGVSRITSFGVREWLQMLSAAEKAELWLARCPEPAVNQLSMIKGFAGAGKVVSFGAPYRCEACGASFEKLLDCEHDEAAIRESRPPSAPCPRCGGSGVFDDDPESYLAFAGPHLGVPLPADVRAAVADLGRDTPAGEHVEKTVDGRSTRIAVRGALDATVRWKRILDGIEGELDVHLAEVAAVAPEGALALENAVRGLGAEVEVVRLHDCPRALAERLLSARPGLRATLVTLRLDGRCASCNAPRAASVPVEEARAAAVEGREPRAACPRCSAPLSFPEARPLLALLTGEAPRPSEPPSAPNRTGTGQVTSTRAPARGSSGRTAVVAVVVALGAAAVGAVALRGKPAAPITAPAASAAPVVVTATAPPSVATGAPEWASRPFVVEGDAVLVVGRGAAPTEDAALASAREDAVDRLATQLLEDLGPTPVGPFVQARLPRDGARRAEALSAVAARWAKQVGATAAPERIDARAQRQGAVTEVVARYRLGKAAYEGARTYYGHTVSAAGLTAAPVYPLLERSIRTAGEVIVVAVAKGGAAAKAGLREGDVLLSVDGRPLGAPDGLAGPEGVIEVKVEEGGVARAVKMRR